MTCRLYGKLCNVSHPTAVNHPRIAMQSPVAFWEISCRTLQIRPRACRTLALLIHLSAVMHGAEVDTLTIGAILGTCAMINWSVFERTVHGALLGVLLGVGAPLTEVVLNSLLGLWHYPRADLPGMVSWCGSRSALRMSVRMIV